MSLSRARLEWYERTSGERVPPSVWSSVLFEHPSTSRLCAGEHVAPYLDLASRPVLLHTIRNGVLVDVTTASSAPAASILLPRGVHGAPWRDGDGMPMYMAIDEAHRLVAWLPCGGPLLASVSDLLLILEAHEGMVANDAGERDQEALPPWMDGDEDDDDLAGEEWKRAG